MLDRLCRWLKRSKHSGPVIPFGDSSRDNVGSEPANQLDLNHDYTRTFPCQFCHQSGKDRFKAGPCRVCNGHGAVQRCLQNPADCKHCQGKGVEPYHSQQCRVCGGSGVIEKEEALQKPRISITYSDSEKRKESQGIQSLNKQPQSTQGE